MSRGRERIELLRRLLQNESGNPGRREFAAMADLLEEVLADRDNLERRLDRLIRNQRSMDARLVPIEYSRVFRFLRSIGGLATNWKTRAGRLLLHSPLHPAYLRLFRPRPAPDLYAGWLALERPPVCGELRTRPLISIVMPVHNPERRWLEAAVDSIAAQTYDRWELCVCDDASRESWVSDYFHGRAASDSRVRFTRSDEPLGIAAASNRAGGLTSGGYVGFLDQDDTLSPYALQCIAEAVADGEPDLVYSDEDQIDAEGRRSVPTFKPDWDPELLCACMYLGHLCVLSRAALDRLNWFRCAFDGAQDYDLALRLADGQPKVRHVPRVLYHWRRHENSTCGNPAAKPYAHAAGRRALEDAVRRRGWAARVADGETPTTFRLHRDPGSHPAASVVICSRSPRLLGRCLRAIEHATSYAPREVVVVQHRVGKSAAMERLLRGARCAVVPYEGPFNFSAMNNRGAEAAKGEVLVFLNDDVEPLAPEWLEALVAQVVRPEIGIAGARLLYPSGAVQHSGIAIGMLDGAGHPQRGRTETPFWPWGSLTRNVSAVTGACLAIRKRLFQELGGFDDRFPVNYNDVDLCLRVRRAGFAVVCETAALLRHREAQTRVAFTRYEERELLYERWDEELERGDPFYSPNLTRGREDATPFFEI